MNTDQASNAIAQISPTETNQTNLGFRMNPSNTPKISPFHLCVSVSICGSKNTP